MVLIIDSFSYVIRTLSAVKWSAISIWHSITGKNNLSDIGWKSWKLKYKLFRQCSRSLPRKITIETKLVYNKHVKFDKFVYWFIELLLKFQLIQIRSQLNQISWKNEKDFIKIWEKWTHGQQHQWITSKRSELFYRKSVYRRSNCCLGWGRFSWRLLSSFHKCNQTNQDNYIFPFLWCFYKIGGFAVVFLTKPNGSNNIRYALKRLYVNNQVDLNAAKREIQIAVSTWLRIIDKS